MRKRLRDHTREELLMYLNNNGQVDLMTLLGAISEILRRMNENAPLLPEDPIPEKAKKATRSVPIQDVFETGLPIDAE